MWVNALYHCYNCRLTCLARCFAVCGGVLLAGRQALLILLPALRLLSDHVALPALPLPSPPSQASLPPTPLSADTLTTPGLHAHGSHHHHQQQQQLLHSSSANGYYNTSGLSSLPEQPSPPKAAARPPSSEGGWVGGGGGHACLTEAWVGGHACLAEAWEGRTGGS